MDNLKLNLKHDEESIANAFGISEQRNQEFMDFGMKQSQGVILGGTKVSQAVENIVNFCETPEEVAIFLFQFGSAHSRVQDKIENDPMLSLLGGLMESGDSE